MQGVCLFAGAFPTIVACPAAMFDPSMYHPCHAMKATALAKIDCNIAELSFIAYMSLADEYSISLLRLMNTGCIRCMAGAVTTGMFTM